MTTNELREKYKSFKPKQEMTTKEELIELFEEFIDGYIMYDVVKDSYFGPTKPNQKNTKLYSNMFQLYNTDIKNEKPWNKQPFIQKPTTKETITEICEEYKKYIQRLIDIVTDDNLYEVFRLGYFIEKNFQDNFNVLLVYISDTATKNDLYTNDTRYAIKILFEEEFEKLKKETNKVLKK